MRRYKIVVERNQWSRVSTAHNVMGHEFKEEEEERILYYCIIRA